MWKEEKRASMILDFDFKSEGIYQRIREEDWRLNTEPEELGSILNTERKTPLAPFLCMFLVLGVTTIFSLLKGSNKGSSIIGVQSCSPVYWILSFAPLPFLVIVTAVIAYTIIKMHIRKQACGYNFKQGDMKWTPVTTFFMTLISFFAGILAGLLGIGGGVLFGPVMLEYGVLPEVAAATSSFMILFTSIASIIQYAILGRVIKDYAIWFGFIGFLSSLVGQALLGRLVKKYQKISLIVLFIAAVIFVSMILLVVLGVLQIIADMKVGESFGFNSPC